MPKTTPATHLRELPLAFVRETTALATSSFGLVVALAWNELMKDLIVRYIEPYFGNSSGTVSKLIYALVMTFLAVFVTMQLVRVEQSLPHILPSHQKKKVTKRQRA